MTFSICLVPVLGMFAVHGRDSGSQENTVEFPELMKEDGRLNIEWLSQAGEYFQRHFAFRQELITANAVLEGGLFQVSADDGVIYGKDGWLYYKDSLDDYLGSDLMDERALFCVARSLLLLQEYAQERGISFLFMPVPNKNTIYGEHMPYYYSYKMSKKRNLAGLYEALEKEGVAYIKLEDIFRDSPEILYHKRDSHWTNAGAALAYEEAMKALGRPFDSYRETAFEVRQDFEGDLAKMLFPAGVIPEDEIYYDKINIFAYVGEVASNFDPKITTVNPSMQESMVMYRDSFGNALLPFFSNSFANCYYSRSVPYPVTDLDIYPADVLIVERAERFLPDMAENPPVMPAPLRKSLPEDAVRCMQCEISAADPTADAQANIGDSSPERMTLSSEGLYWKVEGTFDNSLASDDALVYVRINGTDTYEAFPIVLQGADGSKENGYRLYLRKEDPEQTEISMNVEVFRYWSRSNGIKLTAS